jgi:predicted dehydrogenase
MLGIGLVGIGFMGMIHYLAASRLAGARVVAICSRDAQKRAGDWTGIRGNFGPAGTRMDVTGVSAHEHLDSLLADPHVDLVDLCIPNDQHAESACRALRAGKDVLVEKPIALSLEDADRMLGEARRSGRRLFVAHVLPFFSEFAFALDVARDGRFGNLRAGHFHRLIARPDWSASIGDAARTGGPAIDLHIHDTHFITVLAGKPHSASSKGLFEQNAAVYLTTTYEYAGNPLVLTSVSGAITPAGRPFSHGYELTFDRAAVLFGYSNPTSGDLVTPLTVIHADGRCERPDLPGGGDPIEAFRNELDAVVTAVATSSPCPTLEGSAARDALALALAEVRSAQEGLPVPIG